MLISCQANSCRQIRSYTSVGTPLLFDSFLSWLDYRHDCRHEAEASASPANDRQQMIWLDPTVRLNDLNKLVRMQATPVDEARDASRGRVCMAWRNSSALSTRPWYCWLEINPSIVWIWMWRDCHWTWTVVEQTDRYYVAESEAQEWWFRSPQMWLPTNDPKGPHSLWNGNDLPNVRPKKGRLRWWSQTDIMPSMIIMSNDSVLLCLSRLRSWWLMLLRVAS